MNQAEIKRVLVTGGHGFLGKRVVHFLSTIPGSSIQIHTPRRSDFDLTQNDQVIRLLTDHGKFDAIIHLAAVVGGIGANMKSPGEFFFANLAMGLNLIEGVRKLGHGRFVHVGTVCSYPKHTPVPFKEEDLWNGYPEDTNAPYGIAKKALITMLQAYKKQYEMKCAVVIPTNLYGPGDNFERHSSHVIPAIIRKFEESRISKAPSVSLWGTGSASREFLYVDDAARAIVKAALLIDDPHPINLGTGNEITIAKLAENVKNQCGYEGTITWDASKPDGQPRRCLDTTRATQVLNWKPEVSFQDGLKKTIDWYRSLASN